MTDKEVIIVLDQILSGMDTVKNKDDKSLLEYQLRLEELLSQLPPATYSAITNTDIQKKVGEIWHRTFSKYQGYVQGKTAQRGGINVECKLLMVRHKFYLDCHFWNHRSILHKLYTALNNSLLEPTMAALSEQGILKSTIAINSNNIFSHIEADLSDALKRKATEFSHIKIRDKRTYIIKFIEILKHHGIEHGFSENIRSLLGNNQTVVVLPPPPPPEKLLKPRLCLRPMACRLPFRLYYFLA